MSSFSHIIPAAKMKSYDIVFFYLFVVPFSPDIGVDETNFKQMTSDLEKEILRLYNS